MNQLVCKGILFLSAAGLLLGVAGCGNDDEIKVYRISKEVGAPAPSMRTANPSMGATANVASPMRWQAPETWVKKPASGMRKGSFEIPGEDGSIATVAITSFGGDVGGLPANINRWRNQMGLESIDESKIDEVTHRLTTKLGGVTYVDLEGKGDQSGTRMLASYMPSGNSTWFVKVTGEDKVVASATDDFIEFLMTFHSTSD